MRPILVTGGAGFIGSEFVRQWIAEAQSTVINLNALAYAGNPESLAAVRHEPRHVFAHGSIGDAALVRSLLQEHRPRAIVNFAAESHVDRSIDGPAAFVETNVVGTFRLLEEARHYWTGLSEAERSGFRFLHVSTDEVYGALGPTGKFTKSIPYAPNSPYSASKAASDHFVRAYHHAYGLPTLTMNCSNTYRLYQYPEKLIPLMILNCLEGEPLPVDGDGGQIRDWLYVSEPRRAIRVVFDKGRVGEVYNIGGDGERENLELVRAICEAVDEYFSKVMRRQRRSPIVHVANRPGHEQRRAIEATKMREELMWRPAETCESGLIPTVRSFAAKFVHKRQNDSSPSNDRPSVTSPRYRGQHATDPVR